MSIDITEELHQNFLDFAYEANSERAFPLAVDGLKPGQRACLWEMYTKGYLHKKPHVKSAKIAGGVIASWHPHGDQAVYETFARMSQPWINNIPEVEWHGANGNQIIPGGVASSRYTEARLSKAIEEGMFYGIKKHNVDMIPNFSEDEEWPVSLPAIFPRLLINGSQGIGVSISQYWTCHNLGEVTAAICEYLETGKIINNSLHPDFPTGGIIINADDVHKIYDTGVGKIIVRGKVEIKDNSILITELPYQVYVEPLIEEIKDGITKEKISGIKNIYNKSDKKRLLIEIETDSAPSAVLSQLYKETSLQKNYTCHQYALVNKIPKLLNLYEYLDLYIKYNVECIKKEYEYDYQKAQDRLEIVEGLLKALEDIDNIIQLIKKSESTAQAKENLKVKYNFTDRQTESIVNMKLGKLAHLEGVALHEEQEELTDNLKKYLDVIGNKDKRICIFQERLQAFSKKYATPRKTELVHINLKSEINKKDIPLENSLIELTNKNFIRRTNTDNLKTQKRRGKGNKNKEQVIATCFTTTRDNVLLFTENGMMYKILANKIPNEGLYIEDLIKIKSDERIVAMCAAAEDIKYISFVTKKGYIKKIVFNDLIQTKRNGASRVIKLNDDIIVNAFFLDDTDDVLVISSEGQCIRFHSTDFKATGKTSQGCLSIKLKDKDAYVCAATVIHNDNEVLTIAYENGKGKRIPAKEFNCQKRYGVGVHLGYDSKVAGVVAATDDNNILIIGNNNTICISNDSISIGKKNNKGVELIKGDSIKRIEVC